jgi:hypothetical protein
MYLSWLSAPDLPSARYDWTASCRVGSMPGSTCPAIERRQSRSSRRHRGRHPVASVGRFARAAAGFAPSAGGSLADAGWELLLHSSFKTWRVAALSEIAHFLTGTVQWLDLTRRIDGGETP